jgi:hypothetical protein
MNAAGWFQRREEDKEKAEILTRLHRTSARQEVEMGLDCTCPGAWRKMQE